MKGRNRQNKRDKKRERELISGFPPSTFYLTKARAVPSHSQELGTASGSLMSNAGTQALVACTATLATAGTQTQTCQREMKACQVCPYCCTSAHF